MHWYLKVLKEYFNFEGRARRKEYWMFTLFNILALFAAAMLDRVLGLTANGGFIGPVYGLYALATLIPGLAVGVRRLHDTDRSGWWMLLCLVPLAGIAVLVFLALDGTVGDNRFGPDPKAGERGVPVLA